jgi:hypothetical protein
METVNIQCGQCGNLMAVAEELFGQQARCPHCQQVVLVPGPSAPPEVATAVAATHPAYGPAASPEPESAGPVSSGQEAPPRPAEVGAPPEVTFQLSTPAEHDSIFAPPEVTGDSLFDEAPKPLIELPPLEQPAPQLVAESNAPIFAPPPPPPEAEHGIQPSPILAAMIHPDAGTVPEPADVWPAPHPDGFAPGELGSEPLPSPPVRPTVQHGRRGSWFLVLVVLPLFTYSVLATILVVRLYSRLQAVPRSPLEELPDLEGDLKGATRQKQSALLYERVPPEEELPARLRIALGETLRVGDVEVTPRQVELRKVMFRRPGSDPEKGARASLVLHLHFRNVSPDVVFSPTDPFFDRRWKQGHAFSLRPYTMLEVGRRRFFGGPVSWKPGQMPQLRETIDGQVYRRLKPGEELDTLVCTDPDDDVGRYLSGYQGSLLWRVHFRRGLVAVRDRELPATAVVGVQIVPSQIQRPPG